MPLPISPLASHRSLLVPSPCILSSYPLLVPPCSLFLALPHSLLPQVALKMDNDTVWYESEGVGSFTVHYNLILIFLLLEHITITMSSSYHCLWLLCNTACTTTSWFSLPRSHSFLLRYIVARDDAILSSHKDSSLTQIQSNISINQRNKYISYCEVRVQWMLRINLHIDSPKFHVQMLS